MAVVNILSANITNLNASPIRLIDPRTAGGVLRSDLDIAPVTSGDSIGSTYRPVRIPSSVFVKQVIVLTTAITTCAGDVGVYKNAADGGAVVSAAFFGSAVSLASATDATAGLDVTNESGTYTQAKRIQPLWQALGLTADPGLLYDIVVTLTAAAGSAGTLGLYVIYQSA